MRRLSAIMAWMKRNDIRRIFFIVVLGFVALPSTFYNHPGYGLDSSWMIGLHLAVKKGLVFGTEFCFTYGPLGILSTRLEIGLAPYLLVLFDLYVLINLIYVFNWIIKNNNSWAVFISIFLLVVLLQDFRDHDIVMVLTWLVLFFLFRYYDERKNALLLNAAFLVLLIFFIKVNLGIIALFIFFAFLCFLGIMKAKGFRYLVFFTLGFIVVFIIVGFLLNVNLIQYTIGSLNLISGYNDAMYEVLNNPRGDPTFISAVFVCILFALFLCVHLNLMIKNAFWLFITAVLVLMVYVIFKQGFVRLHIEGYFQYITPFMALLFLFTTGKVRKHIGHVVMITLFVSFLIQGNSSMLFSHQLVTDRIDGFKMYLEQIKSYQERDFPRSAHQIPGEVLADMKGSVDIIPWDICYLYYNDRDYNPRPVIQSYAAFNAYLDQKNSDKYRSSSAPDNILIRYESIDNRYPLFDETQTRIAILQNYQLRNYAWDNLLLEKLAKPIPIQRKITSKGKVRLFENIKIKESDEIQCLYADVEYSLLGKLRRLLFQAPELFITLNTEDGMQYSYKAITTILKGGVIINKFIPARDSQEHLEAFLTFDGTLNRRIISYKLHSPQPWGFASNFEFKVENIRFETNEKSKTLFTPLSVAVPPATNNIRFNVDKVNSAREFVAVAGWAFPAGQNSLNADIYIVLQSKNQSYVFRTQKVKRGDVSAAAGDDRVMDSGFKATLFKHYVADGEYTIGILIKNDAGIYFQSTDQHVKLSGERRIPINRGAWVEGGVKFYIDNFIVQGNHLDINGWIFAEGEDNREAAVTVTFETDSEMKLVPAEKVPRKDVSESFGKNDLDESGFRLISETKEWGPGAYRMGLLLETKKGKRFVRTDKIVSIAR
jgi:hypothetical protein